MELLGFLLAVLAIAFVVAKLIFSTEARNSKASELAAKPPIPSEPPLVETIEFTSDWYFDQLRAGKTFGEIWGMMFPQTLVGGKQPWEVLQAKAENKHDLELMLACCEAQMEKVQIELTLPAPAYFKRVAIILRKRKDYAREVGIINLYFSLCDRVFEKKGTERPDIPLFQEWEKRLQKAEALLEKQKATAILGA